MTELIHFWTVAQRGVRLARLGQHIVLVAISTCVSAAIGVPLGIFSAHRPRVGAPLVAPANMVQTVPSLAMFGFLLPVPFLGGVKRARRWSCELLRLAPDSSHHHRWGQWHRPVYSRGAVALGMTPRDLLWHVEFPLAMPSSSRASVSRRW